VLLLWAVSEALARVRVLCRCRWYILHWQQGPCMRAGPRPTIWLIVRRPRFSSLLITYRDNRGSIRLLLIFSYLEPGPNFSSQIRKVCGPLTTLTGSATHRSFYSEPRDRSQHSVACVASAEQRVAFKEVRLQPKGSARNRHVLRGKLRRITKYHFQVDLKRAARSKRIEGVKPKKRTKGKAETTNHHEEVPDSAMDASIG